MQYSSISNNPETVKFKIGITGIVLIIMVMLLAKKLLLNKYIKKLNTKISTFETLIETELEQNKIIAIEQALRRSKIIESLITFIQPFILMLAAMFICRALEQSIIKLFGVFGFISISYLLGELCNLGEIISIESRHKENNNG
jgi:hypothetical protein